LIICLWQVDSLFSFGACDSCSSRISWGDPEVRFLFSFGACHSCSSRISWGDGKFTFYFRLELITLAVQGYLEGTASAITVFIWTWWHLVVQGFLQGWWCYGWTRSKLIIMPFQFQKPWHECREEGKELITLAIVEHQWRQAMSFSLFSDLKSVTWVGNTAARRYTRKNL
jgi:hypothetical protein